MEPFDIDMSAPVDPSGAGAGLGGPGDGGHTGPNWYIAFGMDLGAEEGTQVFAAFDGHVTKFQPHQPAADTAKVYGAQIFMRSPNDGMGGFYTHLTGTPDGLGIGTEVKRGDLLGTVVRHGTTATHLHLALCEVLGGVDGERRGVDLYRFFLDLEQSGPGTVIPVTFAQDGSAPIPRTD
ncbi:M23 family metallopeptidase [Actinoplanes oblitus]|uniref:M23 family metallopeptidase n=1 Tax=Actinoplanes oblitus TaxID=3040509 RepID=A0ABY8WQ32_9ACTN|nr:M23 family metallopeptidase [Actinoplanes oblitus]WIM97890.1 M23 family metallopeptidase [Actinoplanes oblitus]